ncbi:kinase-like domain-containing protein [Thelephora terrestris]|uniref:Kinase-like domain-containing protein n=1 Tax=Thelephora terrestris TaxID=56493 RepID=A0A9P6HMM4_9AGAM|nr:kinase-like domain-containing protein [Thelephora terrestris]
MPFEAARTSTLLSPRRVDSCLTVLSDTHFWTKTSSTEITPSAYLSGVQSLLNSPSDIARVLNFQGSEAQEFINFLDQALLRSNLDEKHWRRCIRLIRKISKARGIIPSSYIAREEYIHVGNIHYDRGLTELSDGEYQGRTVAIKRLKVDDKDPRKTFKRLCREIIAWKHLTHRNILPLLGVSISTDTHRFRILTEWMPNGNIMRYARSNLAANRLELLSEVMSGVTYLHDHSIVHADLKGANILVDNTGIACIADFGLATVTDLSAFFSETIASPGGTRQWMSPELLDPKGFKSNGRSTRESDCYALGMLIYEVLTGLRPFHDMHDPTFIGPVLRGKRPEKPREAESLGFSDTIWGLVQLCWSEDIAARPTSRELLDHFSIASPSWRAPAVYPVMVEDAISTTDSVLSSAS